MTTPTRHKRPKQLRPNSRDKAFLRTFAASFLTLLAVLAGLVWTTDPFAAFGTGIVPPIVSADRDYKAALYRVRKPSPEVILLGSSRVKTLRPDCVTAITGRPAFNFGVNAGVAEDFLAIFRFLRTQPGSRMSEILLGAEPEAFMGQHRPAQSRSRALASFLPQPTDPDRVWTDLWSETSVRAALRSAWHHGVARRALPQEALRPDGFQVYPLWDDQIQRGDFPQHSRVLSSSGSIRSRFLGETRLSSRRLAQLAQLLREARAAGIRVTAFVPPVHPAFTRVAAGTPFERITDELVNVLREAERQGLMHYVETRSLSDFSGDSTLYYDAIHMTAGNADRLLAAVYRRGARCAVQ